MMQHAVEKPPNSVAYFVSSQVRLLTDFVNLTLMKHFHLYQYCLLHAREVDTVRVDVTLEEPSAPPDLNQAKLREEPTDHGLAGWAPSAPAWSAHPGRSAWPVAIACPAPDALVTE